MSAPAAQVARQSTRIALWSFRLLLLGRAAVIRVGARVAVDVRMPVITGIRGISTILILAIVAVTVIMVVMMVAAVRIDRREQRSCRRRRIRQKPTPRQPPQRGERAAQRTTRRRNDRRARIDERERIEHAPKRRGGGGSGECKCIPLVLVGSISCFGLCQCRLRV